MRKPTFIDLFAGAGGLSEGFIRAGFEPLAHVEMDDQACDTLRTRMAFHYLSNKKQTKQYYDYITGVITRETFLNAIPENILDSVINDKISDQTIQKIFKKIDLQINKNKVDLIIGGPPCQAYSAAGKSRDPKGMKWDKRNFLFRYYGQFLKRYQPKYFVFENVLGLQRTESKKYLDEMLQLFSDLGYNTDIKVLNAEDYGVLQRRRRVIIIGRRGISKFEFPEMDIILNKYKIKKDLFYDLPPLQAGQSIPVARYTRKINKYLEQTQTRNGVAFVTQHITRPHNSRDLEIYSIAINKWINGKERLKYSELPKRLQTHNNIASFLDRYKVVDPDGLCHTVVAHIAKDGHHYIYPDANQIRSISVREAARLQSFPDDYYFEGGRTAAFKQIGNAVPPLMSNSVAIAISKLLNGNK